MRSGTRSANRRLQGLRTLPMGQHPTCFLWAPASLRAQVQVRRRWPPIPVAVAPSLRRSSRAHLRRARMVCAACPPPPWPPQDRSREQARPSAREDKPLKGWSMTASQSLTTRVRHPRSWGQTNQYPNARHLPSFCNRSWLGTGWRCTMWVAQGRLSSRTKTKIRHIIGAKNSLPVFLVWVCLPARLTLCAHARQRAGRQSSAQPLARQALLPSFSPALPSSRTVLTRYPFHVSCVLLSCSPAPCPCSPALLPLCFPGLRKRFPGPCKLSFA